MKLLLCLDCYDIFLLTREVRSCKCGNTTGRYIDSLNAEISGNCNPIGIANTSFAKALRIQQIENKNYDGNKDTCCEGARFEAFIIPDWAKSIKRIK